MTFIPGPNWGPHPLAHEAGYRISTPSHDAEHAPAQADQLHEAQEARDPGTRPRRSLLARLFHRR